MSESLRQFWTTNSGAILISLATGFIFFVLGPIGVWFSGRRIRRERRRRASQALLDLIEDMLVSGETIDSSNLSALFRAVERETDVVLEGFYDADTLFEDLALRFAKSRHLDSTQKNKYHDEIQHISTAINASAEVPAARHIPRAYSKILEDLKQAINVSDSKKANDLAQELEDRLGDKQPEEVLLLAFRRLIALPREHPRLSLTFSLIVLAMYAIFFFLLVKYGKAY